MMMVALNTLTTSTENMLRSTAAKQQSSESMARSGNAGIGRDVSSIRDVRTFRCGEMN